MGKINPRLMHKSKHKFSFTCDLFAYSINQSSIQINQIFSMIAKEQKFSFSGSNIFLLFRQCETKINAAEITVFLQADL